MNGRLEHEEQMNELIVNNLIDMPEYVSELYVIDKGNKVHTYSLTPSIIKYLHVWLEQRSKIFSNNNALWDIRI